MVFRVQDKKVCAQRPRNQAQAEDASQPTYLCAVLIYVSANGISNTLVKSVF